MIGTSLAEEYGEQQRWKLAPQFRDLAWFDQLVQNEFISAEEQQVRQSADLRRIVRFAASSVPYYAELFARERLSPDDVAGPDQLARLPVLTKEDVMRCNRRLRARRLPNGERVVGEAKSSGTTGAPVRIAITNRSNAMFSILWQRQARWFRMDPNGMLVDIRSGREIGGQTPNSDGVRRHHARWRYCGQFFRTGSEIGFNVSNPSGQQLSWLNELRPQHILSFPGVFEELALANESHTPVDSLQSVLAIGSQLTPSLRQRLEGIYRIPVHQTYGLNEIGKVGQRCEAGRYHVNVEHCLVEIVDAEGERCRPGSTGRVVVTGLCNSAMPLLRYDTGDLAEAVDGPCPCGRTLPSFGELAGRFRRFQGLPEGTRQRVNTVLRALGELPPSELSFLREYQLHQDLNDHFEFRLRTIAPIPDAFRTAMEDIWRGVSGVPSAPLSILRVERIARSPSGKHLDFLSDFYDDDYARVSDDGRT